ncbi:MAG: 4Fe-4S dicluster domain-containing protein [Deltaproteobacteria bacterium]|nr:4Fe-4S dicluster domain-containing protein [Deltaproteobacteria bacterium]
MKNNFLERIKRLAEKKLRNPLSRRSFVKGLALTLGLATVAKPKAAEALSFDEFFQKHYKELSPADKERIFARIEKETREKRGVEVKISDPPPMDGVEFAYCLNLSKCIGCRKCVYACVKENNQSRDPQIQYIKVLEMTKGSMDVDKGTQYYDHDTVPQKDKFYMPIACHQCHDAPCVKVCPVEATWKEKDGIVVIDYNWCIGCRYCEAACPYEARRFNFGTPTIPSEEINPDQGYLSNRLRPRGVMEKCHFCLHRTRIGKYPACLEACPTGSRKFGNILDPNSEVRAVIQNKRVYVLKEELNTHPHFYYFFD